VQPALHKSARKTQGLLDQSSPNFLSDVEGSSAVLTRASMLRSANGAFHMLDPTLGMSCMPTKLGDLTDDSAFRRQLKTFLLERAFSTQ